MTISSSKDAGTFLVASPIRFVNEDESGDDGELTALSVGTLDGKPRQERVAVLHSLATRVATHSSNVQSQRTEPITTTLPIRPATSSTGQPTSQAEPLANGSAAPAQGSASVPSQHVLSNGHLTPQPAPATIRTDASSPHDQSTTIQDSKPLQQQPPLLASASVSANGGPPEEEVTTTTKPPLQNLTMPPPPNEMERTKTDFFTPMSEPAEAKQLQ